MNSPYGKPICLNSSIQLLLKQSPAAINVIAETFFFNPRRNTFCWKAKWGKAYFSQGSKHAAIKIYASYVEDQIITTDPKQLLEIKRAKNRLISSR